MTASRPCSKTLESGYYTATGYAASLAKRIEGLARLGLRPIAEPADEAVRELAGVATRAWISSSPKSG